MNHLLTTFEILVTVVAPLLVLYLRGRWKQQTMVACVSTIPVLWYFVYAPIHELSHLLAAYLVGARILDVKLIPSFWLGETAVAWIRAEGFTSEWTRLIMTASPYVLDLVSIAAGMYVLQRKLSRNAFRIGFLFMVLCLRPAFDLVCETMSYASGFRGDLYHIALSIGDPATWALLTLSLVLSAYAIVIVLERFKGFPPADDHRIQTPLAPTFMKSTALLLLTALTIAPLHAQTTSIDSPDRHFGISLHNGNGAAAGSWFLTVCDKRSDRQTVIIPRIALGLSRSDEDFSKDLRLVSTTAPKTITEDYTALHGKRSHCTNSATEIVATFENSKKSRMEVRIRAYNDGIAFRYEFPKGKTTPTVLDELTSYEIPYNVLRWLEPWTQANENLYSALHGDSVQRGWGLPALFCTADTACWFLIHEADVDRNYCATKLSNAAERSRYKVMFPDPRDGTGASTPTITLPWHSPWRTVIMGSLADVTASTLIDDVSRPSILKKTDWIRPGLASWNYWSHNHGTRDFKIVCEFADLAVTMGWPYTLLDWEWDTMTNGGTLEDAVKYIRARGVTPLMWYNSGVEPWATMTPIDRMLTHESRMKEFAWLKKLGVAGVKVDFFSSEKQEMIRYYLDILEDAAQFEIMVYFHGCLVPRGWTRTYPHLMTHEGVRGAEWYNNGSDLTTTAPQHNAILPFTRNVIGPMDYTPVTFTNSQYTHTTSYGHELALGVLFESGIQHMADRPAGYLALPDTVRNFLKSLPNAWDDTQLLDGFPGRDLIMARRHGEDWYIGGINAEQVEKTKTLTLPFLPANTCYTLTLIADGAYDSVFDVRTLTVERSSTVDVRLLRRGGFAARLTPLK